jgi:hypothetical protein
MAYFVMVGEGEHPVMPLGRGPQLSGNWRRGMPERVEAPLPLTYTLDADYGGTPKVLYYEKAIPVMRDDLVQALTAAGVDTVQYFPAVLHEPVSQKQYTDYWAFNIVKKVACADLERSTVVGGDPQRGDADFGALFIDDTRTGGALLFRLAENVSAIVVHESVRAAIEARGIPGLVFYGPGMWSG